MDQKSKVIQLFKTFSVT